MVYAIETEADGLTNLTWELIHDTDRILTILYEDMYKDNIEYNELSSEEDKAVYIRSSGELYNIHENYLPIVNFMHVLQSSNITNLQLRKVLVNAPNAVILKDQYNNHFISLSGIGTNHSDTLAYAYMVIDNEIPKDLIRSLEGAYTIKQEAFKELITFTGEQT